MVAECHICYDLFTPSQELEGTPCGHVFHKPCLAQWIARSETCPSCRDKVTESTTHRVYLSVEDRQKTEVTDFATLENQLRNLQFQVNLRDKYIIKLNHKYKVNRALINSLSKGIKCQEYRARVFESALYALKNQLLLKNPSGDCLNGNSKDEPLPTPQLVTMTLKHQKSTSNVTRAKFRRRVPHTKWNIRKYLTYIYTYFFK